jgi:hypothetical protein
MDALSSTFTPILSKKCPYALNEVTEDLVTTVVGRKSYFDFLKHNPSIDPIYKLYGLKALSEIDSKEVSAHAKRLYLHIHPDKVSGEVYITDLFRIVREAEKACLSAKKGPVEFINPSGFVPCLISHLNKNRWCKVRSFLLNEVNTGDESLNVLATVVFFRLGDFKTAIERIPSQLVKTKMFLEECEKQLSLSLPVEERSAQLLLLLEGFRKLPADYASEKCANWPSEELFNRIIPYHLFVLLKECYRTQNNEIMYEKYLRETIRHCPNGIRLDVFNVEKHRLIAELSEHLQRNYRCEDVTMTSFLQAETSKLSLLAFQKILADLQNTTLSGKNITELTQLISLSINNKTHLTELTAFIENLIGKSKKNAETVSYLNYMSSGISKHFVNYTGYSKQTQDVLECCLNSLEGWSAYYLKNDKELAAHYFLKCKDYNSLGCMLAALRRYAETLETWRKQPSADINRNTFIVMNFCDQTCVSEDEENNIGCLGPVDQMQVEILKSFHK